MVAISPYHLWRGEIVSGLFEPFFWSSISKILIIDQENMFFKKHLEVIHNHIRLRSEHNCPQSNLYNFSLFYFRCSLFKQWGRLPDVKAPGPAFLSISARHLTKVP